MTLAGWRRFVETPTAHFAYDEARLNYHSEMIIVATSAVREVARQGRLLTLLNRREISARRGLRAAAEHATGCPVGTLTADEYRELLLAAGFATTKITRTHPITGGLYSAIVHATTTVPASA